MTERLLYSFPHGPIKVPSKRCKISKKQAVKLKALNLLVLMGVRAKLCSEINSQKYVLTTFPEGCLKKTLSYI